MAGLSLQHVRKAFDNGQVAVADADFVVADGELLVLVGPSGCGKSTLLRLIAGLEPVTSGSILIGNRDVTQLAPRDRDIAMVFQNYALYPHMTVAENLSFGLRLRKQDDTVIDKRIAEAADLLGLRDLLQRKPAQLSGGQRQRVALGRALVRHPSIFLLDEPLSNLDAKLRTSVRTEIARLHRTLGTTMVYVTHDQVEAMTLGQRIVVMKGGEVQQIDAPMAIYREPANLFVAGFLGSPAMNFLNARWDIDGSIWLNAESPVKVATAITDVARQIVLGLRPESLRIAAHEHDVAIDTVVDAVERVGSEAFVYTRYAGQEIVVRTAPEPLPDVGSKVTLYFSARDLHCFDAQSQKRVAPFKAA
jgi:multiple sugar transport system ATP-binding protein